MRKSTIKNLKTCQPREQNMQLSFDKPCSFPAQNSAFSLGQTRLMSGKLSRLKSKHTRKNRYASGLNENGSKSIRSSLFLKPNISCSFFSLFSHHWVCFFAFVHLLFCITVAIGRFQVNFVSQFRVNFNTFNEELWAKSDIARHCVVSFLHIRTKKASFHLNFCFLMW